MLSDPWWPGPGLSQESGEHGRPAGHCKTARQKQPVSTLQTVTGNLEIPSESWIRLQSTVSSNLVPGTGPISRTGCTLHWVRQPAEVRQVLKNNAIRGEKGLTMSPADFASQHCVQYRERQRYADQLTKHWNGTTLPWSPSQEQLPWHRQPIAEGWGVGGAGICTELSQKKRSGRKPSQQHRSQGSWEDKCSRMQVEVKSLAHTSVKYTLPRCSGFIWASNGPLHASQHHVVLERAVRDGKNFSSSWI